MPDGWPCDTSHPPANDAQERPTMGLLRNIRRRFTAGAIHAGWRLAPLTPEPMVDCMQWCLTHGGPITPILARTIKTNMQAAGVFQPSVYQNYFQHIARHLSNGIRIFKLARHPGAIARLADQEIALDTTVDTLREATRAGRGAVLAPAHCCNFLVSMARLSQAVPIDIYLRWSPDQRRLQMKRAWCEATGLGVIIEPPDAANPASRAAICVEALRAGRVLAITPDIAQRITEGTPVRWLNRSIALPSGPASLAMLAEVPFIPMFARFEGTTQILYIKDPIELKMLPRADGGRKEAIRRAMQTWADGFTKFIQSNPEAWFQWADNRWTRVFLGDEKYTGMNS